VSIEGFVHAVVIVDSCIGYRWLYGMKTKDGMLEVIKKWYADIADLRQTYQVVCVMRDNAGENRSNEVFEFLNSHGIRSYFSDAYEQWQNGSAESSIDSIMLLARTVMAESGAAGRFWFRAALASKDARNATFKTRIGTSPHALLHGEPRDVSKFRAFGCRAFVYLNAERREKGKHTPRAFEAVYLGLTSNKSSWVFYLPEKNSLFTSNQAKFDEHVYPFRKTSIIDKYLSDNSIDILYKHPDNISWVTYDPKAGPKHVANYKEVHHDKDSGVSTFQIMTAEKTYTREKKIRYRDDMIQNLIVRHNEETIQAHAAFQKHRTLLGLDP
jgi:hypothetical protein